MRVDLLYVLPFLSAGTWLLAAFVAAPWTRRRTLTEITFGLFAGLLALWALVDGILLQLTDPEVATVVVRVRDTLSSVSSLFLLWFAKWSTRGRGRTDAVLILPVIAGVLLNWMSVSSIVMEAWGPRAVRDVPLYGAWFLQPLSYAVASQVFLAAGLRVLLRTDLALGLRGLSALLATSVGAVLAISTNIALNVTGSTAPGPFSSLLLVPGLIILIPAVLAPMPRSRIVNALLRMVLAFDRDIHSAALLKDDGTVLGMATREPMDAGEFGVPEIMVRMQQFLLLTPRGPPGRTYAVPVGELTFLFRSGSGVTLVVAVRGRDHDFLRSAVDEAFLVIETTPHLLASAQRGSTSARGTIAAVLRALVSGAT